jgi:hypothetical protein
VADTGKEIYSFSSPVKRKMRGGQSSRRAAMGELILHFTDTQMALAPGRWI